MKNKLAYLNGVLFLLAIFTTHGVIATENEESDLSVLENKNIVLLPANFEMYEFGAVSIEPVPEWTELATKMAHQTLSEYLPEKLSYNIIDLPELPQSEADLVTEHVILYETVAAEAISMIDTGGPAWQHKKTNFDYKIGNGLAFLKEKTNADYALVYVGLDTVSTGGRIGMSLLLAAGGVAVPLTGPEVAYAGIIDLDNGDIDWINYKVGFLGVNPREEEGSRKIVGLVFDQYPNSRLLGNKQ